MKISGTVRVTGEGYGFVYVMSYPGSDLVKIGHAHWPTSRARDIGGTLAPDQPKLEACLWCAERREDIERRAHMLKAGQRRNGEWFLLSVPEAMNAIESAARDVSVEIQWVHGESLSNVIEGAQLRIAEAIEKSYASAVNKLSKSRRF
jgi:hypothetical protein